MTEPPTPERITGLWSPEAPADGRAIDRETAMQILHCVDRYLANHTGDVKKLKSPFTGFRLRCGDYRVFFDQRDENTINFTAVPNRRQAYRRPVPAADSNADSELLPEVVLHVLALLRLLVFLFGGRLLRCFENVFFQTFT